MESRIDMQKFMEARERIGGYIHKTPCLPFQDLSETMHRSIFMKLENLQATGGFKLRGNLNKLLSLGRENLGSGVVTASSGNHGLGLSFSARLMDIKATVVVPEKTPKNKVEKLNSYGARVILQGAHYDEAVKRAEEIARETGALYVPSFDDPDIIAGNGTIGLEILEKVPDVGLYICPIGGGGGISGSGLALKAVKPDIKIIGVEAEGAASMKASLEAGKPVQLPEVKTRAEGIAVSKPGNLPFQIVRDIVDEIVTVSEEELEEALRYLVSKGRVVPELAGTASIAALMTEKVVPGDKPVVCLVTGGNIDIQLLSSLLSAGDN